MRGKHQTMEQLFIKNMKMRGKINLSKNRAEISNFCLIIDLIEAKTTGLLALLDEESRLPSGKSDHFTTEVHRIHGDNARLMVRSNLTK